MEPAGRTGVFLRVHPPRTSSCLAYPSRWHTRRREAVVIPGDDNFSGDSLGTLNGQTGSAGTLSWEDCKLYQAKVGNHGPTDPPAPFSPSVFPIVRCYWHAEWPSVNAVATMKVNNVALGFNVFKTTPYWEHDANPAIQP